MTIKAVAKFCSVAAMVMVVVVALGPADWAPRTPLGWQFDHFAGYFAITALVCFAWPRPFVVGVALMTFAALTGGPASFYTGSLVQSCGCILQHRRGVGGGSAC